MRKPVTKAFGVHFHSSGGALTLNPDYANCGENPSGWTITGEVHCDCFEWVNEFKATHPKLGRIEGNFESTVTASSEKAFNHFWKHHEPTAWDYGDI